MELGHGIAALELPCPHREYVGNSGIGELRDMRLLIAQPLFAFQALGAHGPEPEPGQQQRRRGNKHPERAPRERAHHTEWL
jgi:hypothetical protein